MVEAGWDVAYIFSMLDLRADLHVRIDAFKECVTTRFVKIKMLDLRHIREKVDILRVEVYSLTESHMPAISPIVPLFV